MATVQPPAIHLILRNQFEEHSATHFAYRVTDLDAVQGVPVLAFREQEWAVVCREHLEDAERRKTDPFTYGNPDENSLGPNEYAAIVREAGLEPPVVPEPGRGAHLAWVGWWRRIVADLSPARVQTLWHLLQGESFFAVTAVPTEGDLPRDAHSVVVVRCIAWGRRQLGDPLFPLHDHSGRSVFARPERAFADPLAAEAFRARAERQARTGRNPFALTNEGTDPVADRTSLGYPLLRDWLLDCGAADVPDPGAAESDWRHWWDRAIPALSPLRQATAWEAFDRIRFYDVAEVELEG